MDALDGEYVHINDVTGLLLPSSVHDETNTDESLLLASSFIQSGINMHLLHAVNVIFCFVISQYSSHFRLKIKMCISLLHTIDLDSLLLLFSSSPSRTMLTIRVTIFTHDRI